MIKNKRKLSSEEFESSTKMLKLSQSAIEEAELNASKNTSIDYERNFNFKLTDKKAKSNLLKSANGRHFEVETKQMSKLLKFSPGAYLQVVKPLLNQYIKIHENQNTILENGFEIIVHDLREGQELNNKNVDTKIELSVNKQKVIMHCYNTTQNILVNGIGYLNFSEHFLEPLFKEQVSKLKKQITQYDDAVKISLSARGRPLRGKSLKSIRSEIQQSKFLCQKCDNQFESFSKLKKHKAIDHSKSLNLTNHSELSIRHSTRNNSFSESMLLCDNITLNKENVDDDLIEHLVEEHITESQVCDICQENFKDLEQLKYHKTEKHRKEEEGENSHEKLTTEKLVSQDGLDNHKTSHTTEINVESCEICSICQTKFTNRNDLEKHMNNEHRDEPEICETCGKFFQDQFYLDDHRNKDHKEECEVISPDLNLSWQQGEGVNNVEEVTNKAEDANIPKNVVACEEIDCQFNAKSARDLVTHFLNVHNLP